MPSPPFRHKGFIKITTAHHDQSADCDSFCMTFIVCMIQTYCAFMQSQSTQLGHDGAVVSREGVRRGREKTGRPGEPAATSSGRRTPQGREARRSTGTSCPWGRGFELSSDTFRAPALRRLPNPVAARAGGDGRVNLTPNGFPVTTAASAGGTGGGTSPDPNPLPPGEPSPVLTA